MEAKKINFLDVGGCTLNIVEKGRKQSIGLENKIKNPLNLVCVDKKRNRKLHIRIFSIQWCKLEYIICMHMHVT